MAFEHVKPGDSVHPIAAEEFNAMLDAGRAFRNGGPSLSAQVPRGLGPSSCLVWIHNAGPLLKRFYGTYVRPKGNFLDFDQDSDPQAVLLNGSSDFENSGGVIAVAQEPIREDGVGLACIYGPTIFRGDASLNVDRAKLQSDGRFTKEDGTNAEMLVVRWANDGYGFGVIKQNTDADRLFRFKLNEDMAFPPGSGGPLVVADAAIRTMGGVFVGNARVQDPDGLFDQLLTGDEGYCMKQQSSYYPIVSERQPDGTIPAPPP